MKYQKIVSKTSLLKSSNSSNVLLDPSSALGCSRSVKIFTLRERRKSLFKKKEKNRLHRIKIVLTREFMLDGSDDSNLPSLGILGPFILNSSVICLNSSLVSLQAFNFNYTSSHPSGHDQDEFLKALVSCPPFEEEAIMDQSLVHFWNSVFSLMIITAIFGNLAVLYIVISNRCFLFISYFPVAL